jgi:hypothetical protein
MIPLLTAQAIEKKCNFEHVILLGNYELCYSLGMLSAAAGLEKKSEFSNVGQLKKEVLDNIQNYTPANVQMERLLRIVTEMDTYTEEFNSQMYEVYENGYNKGTF